MRTIHSFEIIETEDKTFLTERIYPECKITINSEASLGDVIDAFERFLQAAGYILPENTHLEFVEE